MLACPVCSHDLGAPGPQSVDCPGCSRSYPLVEGIPDFYVPDDAAEDKSVTTKVRDFYDVSPFPNYRDDDDRGTLIARGRANAFTRALDEKIPVNARIVELGCGTGQMPLYMGIPGRQVIGVDLSIGALKVAERFRKKCEISSVRLVRGNLFRPPIKPGSADIAVSTGVLHHTGNPRGGFASLARLARPGGLVVVGLYNTYGRFFLPLLKKKHAQESTARGQSWYKDQHEHPHETTHTVDEVLRWFDEEKIDFFCAVPPITFGDTGILEPSARGSWIEHLLVQLSWLNRAADGGLWITVGVKRG